MRNVMRAAAVTFCVTGCMESAEDKLAAEAESLCWSHLNRRALTISDTILIQTPSSLFGPTWVAVRKADWRVEPKPRRLGEADRLNGIQWDGTVMLAANKWQTHSSNTGNRWVWADRQGALFIQGYLCTLRKSKDRWQFQQTPLWLMRELERPTQQPPYGWQADAR